MSFEKDEEKRFFKMMRDYCEHPKNKEKLKKLVDEEFIMEITKDLK